MKRFFSVALCAVVLVGCAPTPETVTPSPAAEEPSPPSTATPTVDPLVKPQLDELVISPEGLGPVRIGEAYVPSDPATDVLAWDDTFCGFAEDEAYGPDYADNDYGNWVNTYGRQQLLTFLAEVQYGATADSPVTKITTFSPDIRTENGLGIGSTRAELEAAYGAALITYPEQSYYPLVVHGRNGQLVFWFSDETPGVVYMLQVLAELEMPQWSFHATGCV